MVRRRGTGGNSAPDMDLVPRPQARPGHRRRAGPQIRPSMAPGMAPPARFVNRGRCRREGPELGDHRSRSADRERHAVAGVALEAAVELELHERALHLGGARLALPDQLVDQERLGAEALAHAADQVGAVVCQVERQRRRGGPWARFGARARRGSGRDRWPRRPPIRNRKERPERARTSAADSTSVAPSRSSWLVPRWRGSSGLPAPPSPPGPARRPGAR